MNEGLKKEQMTLHTPAVTTVPDGRKVGPRPKDLRDSSDAPKIPKSMAVIDYPQVSPPASRLPLSIMTPSSSIPAPIARSFPPLSTTSTLGSSLALETAKSHHQQLLAQTQEAHHRKASEKVLLILHRQLEDAERELRWIGREAAAYAELAAIAAERAEARRRREGEELNAVGYGISDVTSLGMAISNLSHVRSNSESSSSSSSTDSNLSFQSNTGSNSSSTTPEPLSPPLTREKRKSMISLLRTSPRLSHSSSSLTTPQSLSSQQQTLTPTHPVPRAPPSPRRPLPVPEEPSITPISETPLTAYTLGRPRGMIQFPRPPMPCGSGSIDDVVNTPLDKLKFGVEEMGLLFFAAAERKKPGLEKVDENAPELEAEKLVPVEGVEGEDIMEAIDEEEVKRRKRETMTVSRKSLTMSIDGTTLSRKQSNRTRVIITPSSSPRFAPPALSPIIDLASFPMPPNHSAPASPVSDHSPVYSHISRSPRSPRSEAASEPASPTSTVNLDDEEEETDEEDVVQGGEEPMWEMCAPPSPSLRFKRLQPSPRPTSRKMRWSIATTMSEKRVEGGLKVKTRGAGIELDGKRTGVVGVGGFVSAGAEMEGGGGRWGMI